MDLPKCRTCGERHRLGACPSMMTKSRGGVESGHARSATSANTDIAVKASGTDRADAPVAGVAPGPRDTKKKPGVVRRVIEAAKAAVAKANGEVPPVATEKKKSARKTKADKAAGPRPGTHRGRPTNAEKGLTLSDTKPWIAAGISRASWYRAKTKTKS